MSTCPKFNAGDWRQCEYVSLSAAARIAGRSPGWARRALCTGDLEAFRLPTGGPPVVSVASLARLLNAATPIRGEDVRPGMRRSFSVVASNP